VSVLSDIGRLDEIDWDFPRAGTAPGSTHSIHWFPGNFIPQIPATLVQILSQPGDLILDPFGGSGTTAVEAATLGRRAITADRIAVSSLVSAAKLGLLRGALDKRALGEIVALLTFEQQCRSDAVGRNCEGTEDALSHWYAPDTLRQLRYLWSLVEEQTPDVRVVLTAVFSDVLFDCASTAGAVTRTGKKRRHHWGWIADNVRPKSLVEHNAIRLFRDRLAYLSIQLAHPIAHSAFVLRQDARHMALQDSSVDLIVTSPPYIGMIDYTRANRLLYAWMGWSMGIDRHEEIGARYRRSRRNAVGEYVRDMSAARSEMYRVLRRGTYCALVIGESKRFPGTVNQVLTDFGKSFRLVWGPKARYPTRRRVSDRSARDPVEFVCVFRKP
jgi:DNA methylase